jgi:hypothetical protein
MKGVNSMPVAIGSSKVSAGNASVQGVQDMSDKRGNQQRFNEDEDMDRDKNTKRGQTDEDQYFKKQMEFK